MLPFPGGAVLVTTGVPSKLSLLNTGVFTGVFTRVVLASSTMSRTGNTVIFRIASAVLLTAPLPSSTV